MAKCTEDTIMGGLVHTWEHGAGGVEKDVYKKLSNGEKAGHGRYSSEWDAKGTKEIDNADLKAEQKASDKAGFTYQKTSDYRDPISLYGKDVVQPVVDALRGLQKQIIAGKIDRKAAREIFNKQVVPVIKKQMAAAKTKFGDESFIGHQAQQYLKGELEGGTLFNTSNPPLHSWLAKNVAGNITGFSPAIAGLDFIEAFHKSLTHYGPVHLTKGLLRMAIDGRGIGVFGRMKQVEAEGLYGGNVFFNQESGALRKSLTWLGEHIDPMYYSNNFLVNTATYVGKSAGVPEAEAVRKIAFIKEPGNTPQYMQKGFWSGEVVWARYSTEAFKFYADAWGNLGRGVKSKDPKQAAVALHSLAGVHLYMGMATGSRAMMPLGSDKLLGPLLSDPDSDQDVFEWMDQEGPFNLIQKVTGLDVSRKTQIGGAPSYGMAFSAVERAAQKTPKAAQKAWEAWEEQDYLEAAKQGFEALSFGSSFFTRNPASTKTAREISDLTITGIQEDWGVEDYGMKAAEDFLGKESTKLLKENY